MKTIINILNLATAATGNWLVIRLVHTYNNPVPVGALFVLLISVKCCVEVIRK